MSWITQGFEEGNEEHGRKKHSTDHQSRNLQLGQMQNPLGRSDGGEHDTWQEDGGGSPSSKRKKREKG